MKKKYYSRIRHKILCFFWGHSWTNLPIALDVKHYYCMFCGKKYREGLDIIDTKKVIDV